MSSFPLTSFPFVDRRLWSGPQESGLLHCSSSFKLLLTDQRWIQPGQRLTFAAAIAVSGKSEAARQFGGNDDERPAESLNLSHVLRLAGSALGMLCFYEAKAGVTCPSKTKVFRSDSQIRVRDMNAFEGQTAESACRTRWISKERTYARCECWLCTFFDVLFPELHHDCVKK